MDLRLSIRQPLTELQPRDTGPQVPGPGGQVQPQGGCSAEGPGSMEGTSRDGAVGAREGLVTAGAAPWPTSTDMHTDTVSFLSMSWGSF